MSLSKILLLVWVFLIATVQQLGWFSVDLKIIGYVGLAYVIVRILEAVGVLAVNIPVGRRH